MARLLRIRGKVQGVYYRAAMSIEAERLGITGWVRNRRDGSVEAMVDGTTEAIEGIIEWARIGPPRARVLEVEQSESQGTYLSFEQLPTE